MNNVILICGKSGSGKNQLAEFIKEAIDTNCGLESVVERAYIRGNAQSVKDLAIKKFGWNGEKDQKGRQLLLDLTEEGYAKDKFYWENETMTEAIMHQEFENRNAKVLIIPDWRYASTRTYFEDKAENVMCIRVERPNQEKGTHDNHSSENDFFNYKVDHVVINNKDLDHLRKVAYKIVAHYHY